MKEFNWETAEYPCLGATDNGVVVCFSKKGYGHRIEHSNTSLNFCVDWCMDIFKPYTPPKPKTKLWYWEGNNSDGYWGIHGGRKTEEDIQKVFQNNYRKLEALGFIEVDGDE